MLASRALMFTASSLWVALLLLALVFRGGGAVPVERIPEPSSVPPSQSLAKQARDLVEVGDYEGAWRVYDEALQAAPEDVSLWYALGVALSHLGRRQETEDAFQYVVRRGKPDSEEVRMARRWLVSAGVLAPSVTFTSTPETEETAEPKGVVKGKVTWAAAANESPPKARLLLHGMNGPARGERFTAQVALGEVYRFERLPAGSYRLIGRVGDQDLWDQTLDVEDGKEIALDLSR